MEKIKKILNFALRMEKQGENFYNYYKDIVVNPSNKELFEKLAEIENSHYRFLKEKYDLVTKDETKEISWVVDSKSHIKHPSIFSSQSESISAETDEEMTDLSIMRMAYLIESDFSDFYKTAADGVDDEKIKVFLLTLSEWEEEHKNIFHNRYRDLLKNSWDDVLNNIFPD